MNSTTSFGSILIHPNLGRPLTTTPMTSTSEPLTLMGKIQKECLNIASLQLRLRESSRIVEACPTADERARIHSLYLETVNACHSRMLTCLATIEDVLKNEATSGNQYAQVFDLVFGTVSRVIMERFELFPRPAVAQTILERCMSPVGLILSKLGSDAEVNSVRNTGLSKSQAFASLLMFFINLLSPNPAAQPASSSSTTKNPTATHPNSVLTPSSFSDVLLSSILSSIIGALRAGFLLQSSLLRATLSGETLRLPIAYLISQCLGVAERGQYSKAVSLLALKTVNTLRAWFMGEYEFMLQTEGQSPLRYMPPKLLTSCSHSVLASLFANHPIPARTCELLQKVGADPTMRREGVDYAFLHFSSPDIFEHGLQTDALGHGDLENLPRILTRRIVEELDLYLIGVRVWTGFIPGILSTCTVIASGDPTKRGTAVVQEALSLFTLSVINVLGDLTRSLEYLDQHCLPPRDGEEDAPETENEHGPSGDEGKQNQTKDTVHGEEASATSDQVNASIQSLFSRVQVLRQQALEQSDQGSASGENRPPSETQAARTRNADQQPSRSSIAHGASHPQSRRPPLPSCKYDTPRTVQWIAEASARTRTLCERLFAIVQTIGVRQPQNQGSQAALELTSSGSLDTTLSSYLTTVSTDSLISSLAVEEDATSDLTAAPNLTGRAKEPKPEGPSLAAGPSQAAKNLIELLPHNVARAAYLFLAHAQSVVARSFATFMDALISATAYDTRSITSRIAGVLVRQLTLSSIAQEGEDIVPSEFKSLFESLPSVIASYATLHEASRSARSNEPRAVYFLQQSQALLVERLAALPRVLQEQVLDEATKGVYLHLVTGYIAMLGYLQRIYTTPLLSALLSISTQRITSLSTLLGVHAPRIYPAVLTCTTVGLDGAQAAQLGKAIYGKAQLTGTTLETAFDESFWNLNVSTEDLGDNSESRPQIGLEPYFQIPHAHAHSHDVQNLLQRLPRVIGMYLGHGQQGDREQPMEASFLSFIINAFLSQLSPLNSPSAAASAGDFLAEVLLGIKVATLLHTEHLSPTVKQRIHSSHHLPALVRELPPPPSLPPSVRMIYSQQLLQKLASMRSLWNAAIAPIPVALKARKALAACAAPLTFADMMNATVLGGVDPSPCEDHEREALRRAMEQDLDSSSMIRKTDIVPLVTGTGASGVNIRAKRDDSQSPLSMRSIVHEYLANAVVQCIGLKVAALTIGLRNPVVLPSQTAVREPQPDPVSFALIIPVIIDKLGSNSAFVHQAALAALQRICLQFGYSLDAIDLAVSDHADYLISDLSLKLVRYRSQSERMGDVAESISHLKDVASAIRKVRKARRAAFKAFLAGSALHEHGFALGSVRKLATSTERSSQGVLIERPSPDPESTREAVLMAMRTWRDQTVTALLNIRKLEHSLEDGLSIARVLKGILTRSSAASTALPALRQVLIQSLELLSEHMQRLVVCLPNEGQNKKSAGSKDPSSRVRVRAQGHSLVGQFETASEYLRTSSDSEGSDEVSAESLHRKEIVLAYLSVVLAAVDLVARRIDALLPVRFRSYMFNDVVAQGLGESRTHTSSTKASTTSAVTTVHSTVELFDKEPTKEELLNTAVEGTRSLLSSGILNAPSEVPSVVTIRQGRESSSALQERPSGQLVLADSKQLMIPAIRAAIRKRLQPLADQRIERERLEKLRQSGAGPAEIALEYWRGRQRRLEKRYGQDETLKVIDDKTPKAEVDDDNNDALSSTRTGLLVGTSSDEARRLELVRKAARKKERLLRKGIMRASRKKRTGISTTGSDAESEDVTSSDSDGDEILDSMLSGGGVDQARANQMQKEEDEDYQDVEKEVPEEALLQRVIVHVRSLITLFDPLTLDNPRLQIANAIQLRALVVVSRAIAALAAAGRARGLLRTEKLGAGVSLATVTGNPDADRLIRKALKNKEAKVKPQYKGEKVSRQEKLAAAWGGPGAGTWEVANEDAAEALLQALENLDEVEDIDILSHRQESGAPKSSAKSDADEDVFTDEEDETIEQFVLPVRWDRHLLPQAAQIWPYLRACLAQPFTTRARENLIQQALQHKSDKPTVAKLKPNVRFTPGYVAALELLCVLARNAPKFLGSRISQEGWPHLEEALQEARIQYLNELRSVGRGMTSSTAYRVQWSILFALIRIAPLAEIVAPIVKGIAVAVAHYLSFEFAETELPAMAKAILAELGTVDIALVGSIVRRIQSRVSYAAQLLTIALQVANPAQEQKQNGSLAGANQLSPALKEPTALEHPASMAYHLSNAQKLAARRRNRERTGRKPHVESDQLSSPVLRMFSNDLKLLSQDSCDRNMVRAALRLLDTLSWPATEHCLPYPQASIRQACAEVEQSLRSHQSVASLSLKQDGNHQNQPESGQIIELREFNLLMQELETLNRELLAHDSANLPAIPNPFVG